MGKRPRAGVASGSSQDLRHVIKVIGWLDSEVRHAGQTLGACVLPLPEAAATHPTPAPRPPGSQTLLLGSGAAPRSASFLKKSLKNTLEIGFVFSGLFTNGWDKGATQRDDPGSFSLERPCAHIPRLHLLRMQERGAFPCHTSV